MPLLGHIVSCSGGTSISMLFICFSVFVSLLHAFIALFIIHELASSAICNLAYI